MPAESTENDRARRREQLNQKWEDMGALTSRLRAPGGWLIKTFGMSGGGVHMIFIADPAHKWEL